jgi:para-aminobenzoate synthetase component 1
MGLYFFLFDFDGNFYLKEVSKLQNIYFQTPLFSTTPPPVENPLPTPYLKKFPISYSHYLHAFREVQREISKGNTYLLNLTFPTPIETNYTLSQIYHRTDAPFKLLFKDKFVCFSPERFVKIEGDQISTYPMKGTIDAQIPDARRKILENPKEMAEHLMVVDLLRNDLGIIGKRVRVEKFRYIDEIYAGDRRLLQVSSKITAQLPSDWHLHWVDLLRQLLPAGSISGTPKRKSVEIIRRVEGYERGYYTGIFGVVDPAGKRLESGVIIRYIEKTPTGLVYKSGGGITSDSNPEEEYRELLQKVYF